MPFKRKRVVRRRKTGSYRKAGRVTSSAITRAIARVRAKRTLRASAGRRGLRRSKQGRRRVGFRKVRRTMDGSIFIMHKEYVCDVVGSNSFECKAFELNPGLQNVFPFLSQHAKYYETYKFSKLGFQFLSNCSANPVATQTGTVIMATKYKPGTVLFPNKIQQMEYVGASSCNINQNMLQIIDCSQGGTAGDNVKYVRSAPLTTIDKIDLNDCDAGTLYVSTNASSIYPHTVTIEGTPTDVNGTIGELWVTYAVKLSKPKTLVSEDDFMQDCFYSRIVADRAGDDMFGTRADIKMSKQNNFGIKIATQGSRADYPIGGGTTPTIQGTRFIIPEWYTGYVEFLLEVGNFSVNTDSALLASFAKSANPTMTFEHKEVRHYRSDTNVTNPNSMLIRSNSTTAMTMGFVQRVVVKVEATPIKNYNYIDFYAADDFDGEADMIMTVREFRHMGSVYSGTSATYSNDYQDLDDAGQLK